MAGLGSGLCREEKEGIALNRLMHLSTRRIGLPFVATVADPSTISANAEIAQMVWQAREAAKVRTDVARVARRAIEYAYER